MFAPQEGTNRTKRSIRWTCTTPMAHCSGTIDKHGTCKSHTSPDEVRKCYLRHLVSLGYRRTGPRTLEDPDTGRILVLPKHPTRSKSGKGDRAMGSFRRTSRHVFK